MSNSCVTYGDDGAALSVVIGSGVRMATSATRNAAKAMPDATANATLYP